jgi:hypothetical protein
MRLDRVVDRLRHGAESSLMKHVIDAVAGVPAHPKVTNVAFYEGELSPLLSLHSVPDLFKIYSFARREVIQSYYSLVELQQGLCQIRADKSGYAGYQPAHRLSQQPTPRSFVVRQNFRTSRTFQARPDSTR